MKIREILKIRGIISKLVTLTKLNRNSIEKVKKGKKTNFETKIRIFDALRDLSLIEKDLLYNEEYFK